jgi:hypothetical protein
MMHRIYSPETESERIFLESVLQANDIPYHVDTGGFGSLFPGLQVEGYTRKWIMVPEAYVDEAQAVIGEALPPVQDAKDQQPGWLDRLRIVGEALLFGWFVPGTRRRSRDDGKPGGGD